MDIDSDYTPINIGFDLRIHDDIALELPQGDHLRIRYADGQENRVVEGTPEEVTKVLRKAGYHIA